MAALLLCVCVLIAKASFAGDNAPHLAGRSFEVCGKLQNRTDIPT
jgi:hypothetical protein